MGLRFGAEVTLSDMPATWLNSLGLAAIMAILQTTDGNACRAQIDAELRRRAADAKLVKGEW
jgi:hypothetical protein